MGRGWREGVLFPLFELGGGGPPIPGPFEEGE